jgi:hypothetical protein
MVVLIKLAIMSPLPGLRILNFAFSPRLTSWATNMPTLPGLKINDL